MNGQIVVGWSDSAQGHSALDWAVHQALLTSRSVVVVHEILQDSLGGGAGDQSDRLLLASRSKVDAAVHLLAERFGDLELRIAVEADEPAAGLLRWSSAADILVVGAPTDRHPQMMGTLPDHVAAAAESPVAWIAGGWRPNSQTDSVVVVGATSTPAGRAALRFAAQEAVQMNANLLVAIGVDRLCADGRALLGHINDLAIGDPRLTVEVHWVDTDPAEALVDLSRSAQLLVVGTHHSTDRWSIRLGPVTEVVLRRVHCPVITVARLHTAAVGALIEPTERPAWAVG